MSNTNLIYAIIAMTAVMIFVRIIPLLFFKKKVQNRFLKSVLAYVPCAVLTSLAFPEIFHSTGSVVSASVGAVVALIFAYFDPSLIVVALSSSAAVFLVEQIAKLI